MLETIVLVLVVLWLLGLIAGHTFGGWIYLLLVIALAVLVIRFVSGRKTV
jgi:phage-related holin